MSDDATIEDKFTTSTTMDIPNIIKNTTTVHTTNTVHTTDTTATNKVIETPILSSSPTSNNYYDNIDNKFYELSMKVQLSLKTTPRHQPLSVGIIPTILLSKTYYLTKISTPLST